ncbi:hypothetical protein L210DRAFT_3500865 [Boletus edulis BED1]|uniref:Uncharacterized protein n=1 Tax=Boletus edulis BED1 TaxID=1328754 RepID=A0AAD4C5Z4_BOLED|nr:hypothetical protein L210DRAFT_3500865 [Boletus edulis BED1]
MEKQGPYSLGDCSRPMSKVVRFSTSNGPKDRLLGQAHVSYERNNEMVYQWVWDAAHNDQIAPLLAVMPSIQIAGVGEGQQPCRLSVIEPCNLVTIVESGNLDLGTYVRATLALACAQTTNLESSESVLMCRRVNLLQQMAVMINREVLHN